MSKNIIIPLGSKNIEIYHSKDLNLDPLLKMITPFGATSMRDAVEMAILAMNIQLGKLSPQEQALYTSKIILVTDGADTTSKLNTSGFSVLMSRNLHISIQVITIDIPTNSTENIEIRGIVDINKANMRIAESNSMNLNHVFENLVLQEFRQESAVYAQADDESERVVIVEETKLVRIEQKKTFLVFLVLDISESMTENDKWKKLCDSVLILTTHLATSDNYLGVILFNHNAITLGHPHFLKRFQYSLFDCFKKPGALMWNICCPIIGIPCMQQTSLNRANGTRLELKPFLLSCIYAYPIGCALNRTQLRKDYNIDGSCIEDCFLYCVCCGPCLAGQELIESNSRGFSLLYEKP